MKSQDNQWRYDKLVLATGAPRIAVMACENAIGAIDLLRDEIRKDGIALAY